MPDKTIWSREAHTAAKHHILRGYLDAWFAIFGNTDGRAIFFDGFAGPGVYSDGQAGSPLIALECLLDHNHLEKMLRCEFVFLFNERDPERFRALERVVEQTRARRGGWPPNVKVQLRHGPFGELADTLIQQRKLAGQPMAPTFAFIDPFGYKDVSMQQIAELLSSQRSEAFIYLATNHLNRFSTAGNVDPLLEQLYGTDEFKQAPPAGDPKRTPFLVSLFERQLQDVANFPHVQSFRMRNGKNINSNHMVFASRSITGLDKMKQAMWKVDPKGEFEFSDVLAGQTVLFGDEPDMTPLRKALLDEFGGRTVPIQSVIDFAVTKTPYHSSHVKTRTLKPMENDQLLIGHRRKRKGSYPDGSLVEFFPRS
ncbi:three-Cys-motif partner protein TcmP [Kocuria flava]|uniref:Three-Cys-motif partner protein TcmP n=2 Tax=Kocuria flava TaxID=446860 RepID=A0ABQ0X2F7_9MICC|nr:three-Cys-motif partner protein TcmP [Kocuria flava]GEO91557.1 hypothetical protein KFL01_08630 [Kocuria flava]